MTNWTPGVKADATKVCDLLTDRYTNRTKDAIRRWVVAELKAAEPTLVLDLWGGGKSATELVAAGLNVLSVDDGRSFAEFGITKRRGKRALAVKGDLDGYRTGWGSVVKYLPECDAAWLDFMGHPCHETERALDACKGKKAVAITIMASRLAGHEGLSVTSYTSMYRALIQDLSGMRVRRFRKYPRRDGQWVLVFWAKAPRPSRSSLAPVGTSPTERHAARWANPEYREKMRAYEQKRAADPAWRAAKLARQQAWWADPQHKELAYARSRVTAKERYATDPEYRARVLASQARRMADPEKRARKNAQANANTARRMADPEYRAQANAKDRAYYARKKAEQLDTGGTA